MSPPSGTFPTRIFGPCRSPRHATGRPISAATVRTVSRRFLCPAKSPCEKLKRKTDTPASMSLRTISGESDAGPMVATILERMGGSGSALGIVGLAGEETGSGRIIGSGRTEGTTAAESE
jgi:hypothetical protein